MLPGSFPSTYQMREGKPGTMVCTSMTLFVLWWVYWPLGRNFSSSIRVDFLKSARSARIITYSQPGLSTALVAALPPRDADLPPPRAPPRHLRSAELVTAGNWASVAENGSEIFGITPGSVEV